jgi:hypothetical protein
MNMASPASAATAVGRKADTFTPKHRKEQPMSNNNNGGNYPSTIGNPSGGGRGNGPRK